MQEPENTSIPAEQDGSNAGVSATIDAQPEDTGLASNDTGGGGCTYEYIGRGSDSGNGHLKGAAIRAYKDEARRVRSDELVIKYLPLVHKIARQVVSYLHPPLTREDLVSAGTIGLIKAARDFDPSQEVDFKTYAYIRIRGAVIDELRGWSFAPSGFRKQFDRVQLVVKEMTEANGFAPSDEEVAERMDVSVEKLYRIFEIARARHFLSIHGASDETPALGDSLVASDASVPSDRLEKQEMVDRLSRAISELPERQRRIMILYYAKELTMKEIAEVLKVTESRISQLHASALFKLSMKLRQFDEGGA
jgi:RNA polymerase sigma factor for flagellar operon FliA